MANHQFENSAQFAHHSYVETEKHIELLINYIQACFKPFYSAENHYLALSLPWLNLLHVVMNFYILGNGLIITATEPFHTSNQLTLDIIMDGFVGVVFNIINIGLNFVNAIASLLTFVCRTVATLFNGGYAENQTSRAILSAQSLFGFAKGLVSSPKNLLAAANIAQLDNSLYVNTATFLN
jgi:hypothetical protein